MRREPALPGEALWRRDRDRGRLPRPSVRVPVADRSLAVQQQEVYYLLALENSAHFNPTSTRSWAEYHQQAIVYALAGAAGEGLTSVEQLQLALFESAFADHYLQDSFAAGHMGFNRAASSAAAAKSFHDAWNARGRVATDRAGHRWVTFGDGRLDNPANEEGAGT